MPNCNLYVRKQKEQRADWVLRRSTGLLSSRALEDAHIATYIHRLKNTVPLFWRGAFYGKLLPVHSWGTFSLGRMLTLTTAIYVR
jgi:hypothetical protein